MKLKAINKVIFVLMTCWPAMGLAAVEGFYSDVGALLTDNELFGQCMVLTTYESTIDCPDRWVSVDCKGSYSGKDSTLRLWDSILLARALGAGTYIVVNDAKKHNGYCVAERVDVYN